jgi:hypothetical protein
MTGIQQGRRSQWQPGQPKIGKMKNRLDIMVINPTK